LAAFPTPSKKHSLPLKTWKKAHRLSTGCALRPTIAQKLRSTQRAFDGLNQKQREGGQLTEAQTARLETLRSKLSRLTDTYNKQTTQLRAAGQAVRQHGVNLTAGSGAVQSAIRRTEQYARRLSANGSAWRR
jgi:methyl-accepting chemotaxis protein